MNLSPWRRAGRVLTASGARLTKKDRKYSNRLSTHWQLRALEYYDMIGEVRYASQFYAKQLSRCRMFPAMRQPDGTIEPIEDGPAMEIFDRIQDPSGGRSGLLYDYGRLMFITGEGVLFCSNPETDDEAWRFLWRDEVGEDDNGVTFRKDENGERIEGETGIGYRLWTPHPKHSEAADAPLRPIIDIAEELVLLTAAVRATAISRILSGMLKIPSELSLPNSEAEEGEEDPKANPFMAALIAHIEASIERPGSAEARVPVLVEGAYDYLDRLEWIQLHDPQTDYLERELRKEAVSRMAIGLDFPPEELLGMTDANHWTAKQVQHDKWRSHGVNVAERWSDDIAQVVLRPALREEEFADWRKVVIAWDDSQVVVAPDRSADALEVYKLGGLSPKALREANGFSEKEAPTDDELQTIVAIVTRNPDLIKEEFDIEPEPLPGLPPGPPPGQNGNRDASEGPPAPTRGRPVSRQEARTASILGAAALAMRQCRAKAGARLVTLSKRPKGQDLCPDCLDQIGNIPNSMVASALGIEGIEQLGEKDPINLVKGGTDEFKGILEEWGITGTQRDALCERLETYAAHTLFDERQPDLPPGFISYIEATDAVVDQAAG